MEMLISAIIIIITISTIYFPLKIFLNLLKYREAALGLIFTNLNQSILAFKIFAIAVLIFAISKLMDFFNIIYPWYFDLIDTITTLLYLVVNILLIVAFYKLSTAMKVDEKRY